MERFQSITTDSDGLIDREEFIDFFLTQYRENRTSGNIVSINKIITKKGMKGINETDLIDKILFGVQQLDVDELESEER